MESTFQFLITLITISKSTCNYQGCSPEATCDVEFVVEAVYGCGGVWLDPGVANGEYLCGDGYTICDDHVHASSLGLTQELCLNSTLIQPNYFYTSLQSSSGNLICDDIGFDDIFGCASYESDPDLVCTAYGNCNTIQCGPFVAQMSTFQSTALQYGWDVGQDTTQELQTTIHTTSIGGVLCCKQIPSYSTTVAYTTSQSSYIRSVSCDDVVSGNITNGEIDSYNFENIPSDTSVYVLSDCNTDQNIKFKSYQMFDNNKNILTESYSDWWVQCKEAQGLDFTIWDINSTYGFDVYTEYNSGLTAQYYIRLSCGQQPKENISPDCYIGCGESVTGYYEYDRPHFCEITSFTKGFGGNVFNSCGSNYMNQQLMIYPDDMWQSRWNWDDQLCANYFQRLNWFSWDDTSSYFLQIGGYESGNYTVSMECGVPINLSGHIHCPNDIITGSLNNNEVAWYQVHFDSNLPATFDACLSDDSIRIELYDSQLFDANHFLQHVNGRCVGNVDYYELYPSNNDTYYVKIRNGDNDHINAAYNISYFCEIKRRKSTNYGYINCGDFVNGTIDFGDTHLYTLNSTMFSDEMFIIGNCDSEYDVVIDLFDGDNWGTSWHDYNWQCDFDTLYVNRYYDDIMEFEVFSQDNTFSEGAYYGFNIYCGDHNKPQEPMQHGGVINCGDHNIFGKNNMFFNFSNPKDQTVTFSVCSITLDGTFTVKKSNGNVIFMESNNYYDTNKDCPHWTVDALPAGNYTFESKRDWGSGIFLLDVICDTDYVSPNPKTLQSYVADNSCNYFVRDDSIVPMDVCLGSYDDKEDSDSKKYTCVNGEAVALEYNTSNCDSIPIHDDDTNTSSAEYNCDATESCPYVLMTHYPMAYDTNINDYICSQDISAWHKWAEVIDFCRIRMGMGFTSSIVEYNDGTLTESYYVGYDCGLTAPNKNEYIYHKKVLRDHQCCGDEFLPRNCESMSDGGTYMVIDYHSPGADSTQQPQTTAVTSGNSIFTTASSNSITNSETLTAHPTDVLVTESISTTKKVVDSNSGVIITMEWLKSFLLLQILMVI